MLTELLLLAELIKYSGSPACLIDSAVQKGLITDWEWTALHSWLDANIRDWDFIWQRCKEVSI